MCGRRCCCSAACILRTALPTGSSLNPLLMVYAFHVFLFYYETIFNVYVAAFLFLYVILVTRDYRLAIKFGLAQFAGGLTAALVLLAQLVNQFGWEVVRADIYYTFVGRNFATDAAAFLEEARAFYATHNIAFWLNIPESGQYRNVAWTLRVLFQDHSVHTPPWSLVVLAFAAAELIRRVRAPRAPFAVLSGTADSRPFRPRSSWGLERCRVRRSRSASGTGRRSRTGVALFDFRLVAHPDGRRNSLCRCDRFGSDDVPDCPPGLNPWRERIRHCGACASYGTACSLWGGLEPIWRAALAAFAGYTVVGAFFVSAMLLLAAWYAFGAPIATAWE